MRGALAALAFLFAANAAFAEPLAIAIESAEAGFDQATGQPVLTLTLTPGSSRAFADLTAANVGKVVELRIDGEVVMAPVVREPIAGGSVQVSGEFTADIVKEIATRLSAGTSTVEVEVKAE